MERYLKMNTHFLKELKNIYFVTQIEKNLKFSNYEKSNGFPEWWTHSLEKHTMLSLLTLKPYSVTFVRHQNACIPEYI